MKIAPYNYAMAIMLASGLAGFASAATLQWSGTNGGTWNDSGNWSDITIPESPVAAIPANGDDLVFVAGIANRAMTNDIGNITLRSISINSGLYSIAAGNTITFAVGGDGTGSYINNNAGGSSSSASMTIFSAMVLNDTLTVNNNGAPYVGLSGAMTGSGGLTINGTGTVRMLDAAKSYTGNTTINGGTLYLAATDILPKGAGYGDVYIGASGYLYSNNQTYGINGLNGSGAVTRGGSNTRTLTIGNGDANGNFTGSLTWTGGSSGIVKTGTGTQTLGTTTVASGITVNGGKLLLNGTTTAANLTVASNATVGGKGIVTLSNALTMNANSSLSVILGGSAAGQYGQIRTTNAINLDATATLSASLDGYTLTGTEIMYILVRSDSAAFTNLFAGTTEGGTVTLGDGLTAQITYLANWAGSEAASSLTGGNDVALYNFVAAEIPEPASLAICAFGSLFLIRRRR